MSARKGKNTWRSILSLKADQTSPRKPARTVPPQLPAPPETPAPSAQSSSAVSEASAPPNGAAGTSWMPSRSEGDLPNPRADKSPRPATANTSMEPPSRDGRSGQSSRHSIPIASESGVSAASNGGRLSASTPLGRLRVEAGLSQTAVANHLELSSQTLVSMVERGVMPLTRDLAEAMAALYDVSLRVVVEAAPILDKSLKTDLTALELHADKSPTAVSEEAVEADGDTPTAPPEAQPGDDPRDDRKHGVAVPDGAADESGWFAGSDAHSKRRRELRDAALTEKFSLSEAQQIAVVRHTPRCDAQATYDFFVDLEQLTKKFERQFDVARNEGISRLARSALQAMQYTAIGYGANSYASAFGALLSTSEAIPPVEQEQAAQPKPAPRDLEDFRAVVEERRTILVDERGLGHERRFDAYVTATRGDGVLAAGFDHQRGVIRAINLSALPSRPRTAPDAHFDPPDQQLVDQAKRSLEALGPDGDSLRVVVATPPPATRAKKRFEAVASNTVVVARTASAKPVTLPPVVDLIVGSHHLLLDREIRSDGAIGFSLSDPDTGRPARGGVRVREDDDLPSFVVLGQERVRLDPSYRWLPDDKRRAADPEPFDRARASHTNLVIGGRNFNLELRVARRSTEQWIIRAKLTAADETRATTGDQMPPRPSIRGAPVLPTPLFKLDGRWNWRWAVRSGDSQLVLPRQLFELNGVDLEALRSVTLADGSSAELTPTKYATGFRVHKLVALRRASRGRPGDYVFMTVDNQAALSFHRVTKQLMGRVQSHMKMASLLCGLTDEHPTLAAVLWSLGVVDESGTIDDAIAICEQRSDGPLVRELRSCAMEAGPPPDLDDIFKAL